MSKTILIFLIGYQVRKIQKSWFGQAVRVGVLKAIDKNVTKVDQPKPDLSPVS